MPSGVYQHKPHTEEWKKRTSEVMKGRIPWNKNKNGLFKHSKEAIEKIKKAKIEYFANHSGWNKGRKGLQIPWNKNKTAKDDNRILSGENIASWRGGISFEPYPPDWTKTLKRSIRERDKYTCRVCSESQKDITFDIHHIDYDKKNCNPDNLITLCNICHFKTRKNREYWQDYLSIIINTLSKNLWKKKRQSI